MTNIKMTFDSPSFNVLLQWGTSTWSYRWLHKDDKFTLKHIYLVSFSSYQARKYQFLAFWSIFFQSKQSTNKNTNRQIISVWKHHKWDDQILNLFSFLNAAELYHRYKISKMAPIPTIPTQIERLCRSNPKLTARLANEQTGPSLRFILHYFL